MWISKDGEERRQELLDASLRLFCEKGYDKTSLNDILERVGVTKGAFYYYFESKEEALDALVGQQAERTASAVETVVDNPGLPAVAKLNRVIAAAQAARSENREERLQIFAVLDANDNAKFKYKLLASIKELGQPILKRLIEQGVREGSFHVSFIEETAALLMDIKFTMAYEVNQILMTRGKEPDCESRLQAKCAFYRGILARILGLDEGDVDFGSWTE